jgi:hypothetical protein
MKKDDKELEYVNQLKNYLFKGLKCHAQGMCVEGTEYDDEPQPIVYELDGIYHCPERGFICVLTRPDGETYDCYLEDFYPFVRTLDLVSEIEHNGHRFRPLLRIVEKYLDNFEDVKFVSQVTQINSLSKNFKIEFTYFDMSGNITYSNETVMIYLYPEDSVPVELPVKPELFLDAFYNWHFWMFDIPKNFLLIDKLTNQQLENV